MAPGQSLDWDDLVLVTTAISSRDGATFRKGLYGDGDASEDRSVHEWRVIALDRRTGLTIHDRPAYDLGLSGYGRQCRSDYIRHSCRRPRQRWSGASWHPPR